MLDQIYGRLCRWYIHSALVGDLCCRCVPRSQWSHPRRGTFASALHSPSLGRTILRSSHQVPIDMSSVSNGLRATGLLASIAVVVFTVIPSVSLASAPVLNPFLPEFSLEFESSSADEQALRQQRDLGIGLLVVGGGLVAASVVTFGVLAARTCTGAFSFTCTLQALAISLPIVGIGIVLIVAAVAILAVRARTVRREREETARVHGVEEPAWHAGTTSESTWIRLDLSF